MQTIALQETGDGRQECGRMFFGRKETGVRETGDGDGCRDAAAPGLSPRGRRERGCRIFGITICKLAKRFVGFYG